MVKCGPVHQLGELLRLAVHRDEIVIRRSPVLNRCAREADFVHLELAAVNAVEKFVQISLDLLGNAGPIRTNGGPALSFERPAPDGRDLILAQADISHVLRSTAKSAVEQLKRVVHRARRTAGVEVLPPNMPSPKSAPGDRGFRLREHHLTSAVCARRPRRRSRPGHTRVPTSLR